MSDFTLDNIDMLVAHPLPWPLGWRLTFRSTNGGKLHQLYVDGRLVDWTHREDERAFCLPASNQAQHVVIAAVGRTERQSDLSHLLPQEPSGLLVEVKISRSCEFARNSLLALLSDHGTDRIDPTPLASAAAWPAGAARWAWGEDAFGSGGFGVDASMSPPFGSGLFGKAMLGIDEDVLVLRAVLDEGRQRLYLQSSSISGQTTIKFLETH